jgi:uncharacterized FlaG/YvyC family protein
MAGFIANREKYCIRLGNLQKDRYVERRVFTSLVEKFGAPVKTVRRLEVLNHRDFVNQSVVYVYLHEGNDHRLKDLASKLNGIEFELADNHTRRVSATITEAKELPHTYRNLQPNQGATVRVTMSEGKVKAIEDETFFDIASDGSLKSYINYDEEDTRCESDFDGSDESDNEQKPLASSQPQETPTAGSQPEQHEPSTPANPSETATTTTSESVYPTLPKSQPTHRTENIADRVERLEKEMAELKRHVRYNSNDETTEFF